MRVLLSAYACGPGRGSEEGGGWNWSAALADVGHDVTVLTIPRHRAAIDTALAQRPDQRLRMRYVEVPRWARRVPGQAGVYARYLAWQWAAYREARRLIGPEGHDLDVVHHVSWGSLQLGTWMGRLPLPLVFGPAGGGQTAARSLRRFYAGNWRTEALRTLVTRRLMPIDPFARMTAKRARVVLVCNDETATLARRLGGRDVRFASDVALPADGVAAAPSGAHGGRLRLLWVGRLLPRKGLPLALEAVALARRHVDVELTVIGAGPQSEQIRQLTERLGIDDIVDHRGRIPYDEVQTAYQQHDVLLFPSLRDSSGAQILEAMAAGLPVVALDQSGAAKLVGPDRGLLIPPGESDATLTCWAEAIERLARDRVLLRRLGDAALQYAGTQRWPQRAEEMSALYRSVVLTGRDLPDRGRGGPGS